MDKQLEQLMEWLRLMAAQIPDADGTTAAQRLEAEGQRNEAVLRV
jgi:transcription-repair coupling factor (superfamily II helicase)